MQRARINKKGAVATPVLFWRSKMGAAAMQKESGQNGHNDNVTESKPLIEDAIAN